MGGRAPLKVWGPKKLERDDAASWRQHQAELKQVAFTSFVVPRMLPECSPNVPLNIP
jgi:hypothetical protein